MKSSKPNTPDNQAQKTKALSLKEKELAIKEKELAIKEKELAIKEDNLENRYLDLASDQEKTSKNLENSKKKLQEAEETNLISQQKNNMLSEQKTELDTLQSKLSSGRIKLEKRIMEVEQSIPHKHEDYKNQLEQLFSDKEAQLMKLFSDKEAQLEQIKNKYKKSNETLTEQQATFTKKSEELDYRLHNFELECEQEKHKKLSQQQHKLQAEREQYNKELVEYRRDEHAKLSQELEQQRNELEEKEDTLIEFRTQLNLEKKSVAVEKKELMQEKSQLGQTIETRAKEHIESLMMDLEQSNRENERLRNNLTSIREANDLYEDLKRQIGDDPETVLEELTARHEQIKQLNKELLERPSKNIQDLYDQTNHQLDIANQRTEKFQHENQKLSREVADKDELEYELDAKNSAYQALEVRHASTEADNNRLKADLERLSVSYETEINREDRLKQIQTGIIKRKPQEISKWPESTTELGWLESIQSSVANYGLQFNPRIVLSFHTALKIAEWSPLTVLAGVSGTGKSELPKLYSHFGGINFLNVPVQPNWDSQESMLGYFNAIDNVFDAQPSLKLLIQSQLDHNEHPQGLDDQMSLLLMDEMNLAHVELYFADFLSKLEERRGTGKDSLPKLPIKLGSKLGRDEQGQDLNYYDLPLGRNMLFAGTMNQDETTKSLSDKVLDRGVTIFFPRPDKLVGRERLKPLQKPTHFLHKNQWKTWVLFESKLPKAQQNKYKNIIESINNHLGNVGKALGHRVWQSIEYFMVNHPLVMALSSDAEDPNYLMALKFAFEDQLVQKVMPKLRGIETRGIGKDRCLSEIQKILEEEKFNLVEDFEKAMLLGHGQFSWSSADYLNDQDSQKSYADLLKSAMQASNDITKDANKAPEETRVSAQAKAAPKKETQKKSTKPGKAAPTKKTESVKKFMPTPLHIRALGLRASQQGQEISDLTAEEVKDCLKITGFEAKDVIAYLKDHAPEAGV